MVVMYYKDANEFKETAGYDISGLWFPRVTKIVEIKAKPALYKFYGELNSFDEGEEIKAKSASEGTLIHETVESLLLGQKPAIEPSIAPSVAAFMEFMEERSIKVFPEYVERQLVNKDEKYAGTLDALAYIDGKVGVMDIKTSQSIYRDYNLQTSAYMAALDGKIKRLDSRWILRIDQNKTCKNCRATLRQKGGRDKIKAKYERGKKSECDGCEHEWGELTGIIELKEFPYWREDYKAFQAAKRLWEWENTFWLKQIGYL